ncbi:UBX domain-containing protein 8 isoform X2 [Eleutherodactylus coqui]|uniref:UBX domain-containing protein 8 isoform X2 n=1 Tax=Eleutherodactylus coqui TaxID=57060 RepID=UPI0034619B96
MVRSARNGAGNWNPEAGFNEVVSWMGKFMLILALMTFLVSVVVPYFHTVYLPGGSQEVPQEENERQEMVRKEQQELLSQKASEYTENIVKPRREEKLKKLEERFYKMTGQTWKLTEGYTLGEAEDQLTDSTGLDDHFETANVEARRKRKLPEQETKPLRQYEQPLPKRVITLPEEPSESEEDVITISLRCPSGRVYRRRFYKSCGSLVLLDWMMKIGYHPVFYLVCTPMPRCPLALKENATLENIGITRHTALTIEEKDRL